MDYNKWNKHLFKLPYILRSNYHYIWVIFFFILNGYNQQSQEIFFWDLLILFATLTGISFVLFLIIRRLTGSLEKAGIFTSISTITILFFGVLQDLLGSSKLLAQLSSLPFYLSFIFCSLILLFAWIKRTKLSFRRAKIFLNLLFLVYIFIECLMLIGGLVPVFAKTQDSISKKLCNGCSKPDVYLIILDEYFGTSGLRKYFKYDNSVFEHFLKLNGFKVIADSKSNYDLTLFSMASMLNMDYLRDVSKPVLKDRFAYVKAMAAIENNAVSKNFMEKGYKIINRSIFNLKNSPAPYSSGLLPDGTELINSKTLYYRVSKNLPYFLARHNIRRFVERQENNSILANQNKLSETLIQAKGKDSVPIFTYVHLLMPHKPYSFDSSGIHTTPYWEQRAFSYQEADEAYLQYLIYCNKVIARFVKNLLKATNGEAVIILMSDHGYRSASVHGDKELLYEVLNAVYLPGFKEFGGYDGMSNVNQFRILLNNLFHEKREILKDSIVRN